MPTRTAVLSRLSPDPFLPAGDNGGKDAQSTRISSRPVAKILFFGENGANMKFHQPKFQIATLHGPQERLRSKFGGLPWGVAAGTMGEQFRPLQADFASVGVGASENRSISTVTEAHPRSLTKLRLGRPRPRRSPSESAGGGPSIVGDNDSSSTSPASVRSDGD